MVTQITVRLYEDLEKPFEKYKEEQIRLSNFSKLSDNQIILQIVKRFFISEGLIQPDENQPKTEENSTIQTAG